MFAQGRNTFALVMSVVPVHIRDIFRVNMGSWNLLWHNAFVSVLFPVHNLTTSEKFHWKALLIIIVFSSWHLPFKTLTRKSLRLAGGKNLFLKSVCVCLFYCPRYWFIRILCSQATDSTHTKVFLKSHFLNGCLINCTANPQTVNHFGKALVHLIKRLHLDRKMFSLTCALFLQTKEILKYSFQRRGNVCFS